MVKMLQYRKKNLLLVKVNVVMVLLGVIVQVFHQLQMVRSIKKLIVDIAGMQEAYINNSSEESSIYLLPCILFENLCGL